LDRRARGYAWRENTILKSGCSAAPCTIRFLRCNRPRRGDGAVFSRYLVPRLLQGTRTARFSPLAILPRLSSSQVHRLGSYRTENGEMPGDAALRRRMRLFTGLFRAIHVRSRRASLLDLVSLMVWRRNEESLRGLRPPTLVQPTRVGHRSRKGRREWKALRASVYVGAKAPTR
jgi:hypothetical protein